MRKKEEKEEKGLSNWASFLLSALPLIIGASLILYNHISDEIISNKRNNIEFKIREELNADNYENAYTLLNELKSLGGYDQLRDEIVRREAIYLLSQDDEQCSKRIIYLLNQYYDSEYERNKIRKDLYELAKNVGNESAMNLLEEKEEE